MRYGVIYADPPWAYENPKGHKAKYGGTPYRQMSQAELMALPVRDMALPDSFLFLWATMPKLPEALDVMSAWGFRFTCVPFVWVKTNPRNGGIYSGLGHWTNGNAEIVMMGKRGRPERRAKDVKQIVVAPRGRHSRKPPEVRRRIRRLVGDIPALELFATETAEGWDSVGMEIDGRDIREALRCP